MADRKCTYVFTRPRPIPVTAIFRVPGDHAADVEDHGEPSPHTPAAPLGAVFFRDHRPRPPEARCWRASLVQITVTVF